MVREIGKCRGIRILFYLIFFIFGGEIRIFWRKDFEVSYNVGEMENLIFGNFLRKERERGNNLVFYQT